MRIRIAIPEDKVTPEALNGALEAVTRVNESLIGARHVPLAQDAIKRGVRWSPEPFGEERFDNAAIVVGRGWGDCDDLAPYEAASLRVTGADPGAFARVFPSGPNRWHAVVQRSDGSIDDPSQWAGMNAVAGAGPAVTRAHRPGSPAIAMVQRHNAWHARAELPWYGQPRGTALVGYAAGDYLPDVLSRCVQGTCIVGQAAGIADHESIGRTMARLHEMMHGSAGVVGDLGYALERSEPGHPIIVGC